MSPRCLISLVIVAVVASGCAWSRDAKVRRAVRHELHWVDEQLIGEIRKVPELSLMLGPVFAVQLKTSAPFGQTVFCVTERSPSRRLLVFYGCRMFSPVSHDPPTEEVAIQQLKTKVEAFNRALGAGVQLGALNEHTYAWMLSWCLFSPGMRPWSPDLWELSEPRITPDLSDGGHVYRLFHSYDEKRREVRYWIVDTKDGGFIQSWKIVVQSEQPPNQ